MKLHIDGLLLLALDGHLKAAQQPFGPRQETTVSHAIPGAQLSGTAMENYEAAMAAQRQGLAAPAPKAWTPEEQKTFDATKAQQWQTNQDLWADSARQKQRAGYWNRFMDPVAQVADMAGTVGRETGRGAAAGAIPLVQQAAPGIGQDLGRGAVEGATQAGKAEISSLFGQLGDAFKGLWDPLKNAVNQYGGEYGQAATGWAEKNPGWAALAAALGLGGTAYLGSKLFFGGGGGGGEGGGYDAGYQAAMRNSRQNEYTRGPYG